MNGSAGLACCGCLPLWHCAIAEWSHFVNYGYCCGPRDFWRIKDGVCVGLGGLMMATGISVWLRELGFLLGVFQVGFKVGLVCLLAV